MGWQEDLARTNDPWLMTPAAVQASAAASNADRGRRAIQNYVAANPSETRGQGFNALDIGTEIRDAYMDQRGSGIPWVNKGMNISDFLKSGAASNIAAKYGNVLDPDQAYEEWIRSQTAPGTVDTRNQYQLEMNQLRDQYPEAYAEEFPWADAMMKGLPAIAKLAMSKLTGGATTALSAIGSSGLGGDVTGLLQNFGLMADEDEEYPPWMWWKKANGGIASLNGGGAFSNWDWSPPGPPVSGPHGGGNGGSSYGSLEESISEFTPEIPEEISIGYGEGQVDPSLAAAAGLGPAAGGFGGTTEGWGEGIVGIDDSEDIIDTGPDIPSIPTGISPGTGVSTGPVGGPLFNEGEGVEEIPRGWEEYLREKGKKQFDTQFMASQYLYDKSRGRFDQGGLADMSENALGEFDVARSTWKWKYDNKINQLMDGGFTLKEAIDELWNQGWGMPYKGFSLKERT